jgi:hypothetical protein
VIRRVKQDEARASYAPKIDRSVTPAGRLIDSLT